MNSLCPENFQSSEEEKQTDRKHSTNIYFYNESDDGDLTKALRAYSGAGRRAVFLSHDQVFTEI